MKITYHFIINPFKAVRDAPYRYLPLILRERGYNVSGHNPHIIDDADLEFVSNREIIEEHKKEILGSRPLGITRIREIDRSE